MILRRWFPRWQTAACSGCGATLTERRRKPCPVCGDTRRSLSRTANERIGAADKPS